MSSWLVILLVLALLYLLYKVVVFVRADADLTLLSRTLDTRYFDNKVVWVTGASSGSELLLHIVLGVRWAIYTQLD